MSNPLLYIAQTDGKGRGVFAGKNLGADLIVEESPVIVMSATDRKMLDQTRLHDYIFEWKPGGADMCCMALGWIPIYNHSRTPNCEYFMDYDRETIFIKTLRKIAKGEELTINYDGEGDEPSVIWFDVQE